MNNYEKDIRIKSKHFSLKEFLITFFVLLTLSAGQVMILNEYVLLNKLPLEFVFGMIGYWGIVAASFSLVTHFQIKKKFDKPMRTLSKAAKEVAQGDFSVYVPPVHTKNKDYVDVMFEDFNTMVETLGSIDTIQQNFMSNVSHEFKTPLSVIENYAYIINKKELSKEELEDISKTIIASTKKLTTLVTNILKLNKLENQNIKSEVISYNLSNQLADCALSNAYLWEEKDIEFIANIEEDVYITSDSLLLEIIFNNLITNAIKFTNEKGVIEVSLKSNSNEISVIIKDNGIGMTGESISKIFDKFYQGDISRTKEGNGLGLSLVSEVLELVGGRILVESEVDKGSTFTVIFNK